MMGSIENQLASLGPTTFVVSTMGGVITSEEQFREMLKRKPIKLDYADDIEESCSLCEIVSRRIYGSGEVKYRDRKLRDVTIMGVNSNFIDIVDFEVELGRFFSQEEDLHRRQVAFIGQTLREEFFSGVDPIGKEIRIRGSKFTVVGVAKKRGSLFGNDQDDFAFIPVEPHLRLFGDPGRRAGIFVKAASLERLDEAMDEVRLVLRARRQVPFDKPDDFNMITADNLLASLNAITRIFRLSLVGISSIALVVGGIVVMNIMMVSVTERTREIGIRKSIGARRRHILLQFLFEALMTTLSGGLVGIVLGYILAGSIVELLDATISPSALAIISGLSISVGIGLIFGIYPAMKAARLDPIKALSYE
jgi:putative ABC transport system permease protein